MRRNCRQLHEVVMSTTVNAAGRRILRDPEVTARTGKGRVQRWRDIKAGIFPAPIQIGPNSIGWYEDEIDAWLAARPRRTYGTIPPSATA
jgi:predicted DNA-binding transcriptional regulator AlpA